MPYIENTRLLVETGMSGATGNIYFGLHEYESMSFVLHTLRKNHSFIDVGANVGSYTVLAAGVVGCSCVSIEPVPLNYQHLRDNVRLNNLESRTNLHNAAAGSKSGVLHLKAEGTPYDRVLDDAEEEEKRIKVSVLTLDSIVPEKKSVLVVKVDVEGWETEVLNGAEKILQRKNPTALIVELDGAGRKYGFDDSKKHLDLIDAGFTPVWYAPQDHDLYPVEEWKPSGNTIYVNNRNIFETLTKESRKYSFYEKQI